MKRTPFAFGHELPVVGRDLNGSFRSASLILNTAYIGYGYALFMDNHSFDQLYREMGESCDYAKIRQEVADLCFAGDISFMDRHGLFSGDGTDEDGYAPQIGRYWW